MNALLEQRWIQHDRQRVRAKRCMGSVCGHQPTAGRFKGWRGRIVPLCRLCAKQRMSQVRGRR